MTTVEVLAQAKVNLLLRVLARESSGYHGIETVFQRLELADRVRVSVGGDDRTLTCDGPAMPAEGLGPVERNLAWRAARLYAERTGWPTGFSIHVEKHIPVGGGLGGGSADAGAVLRALDTLSPKPLGPALLEIAAILGADVPFLASDSPTSLAWGRGERMLRLAALPSRAVALLVPPFAVSTADAYGWLSSERRPFVTAGRELAVEDFATWDGVARVAANDFEAVVGRRHEEVARCVAALRQVGARLAMLSGSGSAVFGVFDATGTSPDGRFDEASLSTATGVRVIVTRTASRVVG